MTISSFYIYVDNYLSVLVDLFQERISWVSWTASYTASITTIHGYVLVLVALLTSDEVKILIIWQKVKDVREKCMFNRCLEF